MSLASRLLQFAIKRKAAPLAAKAAKPLALPAPPKVLALPAPKPKSLAAKPRGGQFFPDARLAARDAQAAGYKLRDRGQHAAPETRYQVVRPDGRGYLHGSDPAKLLAQMESVYRSRAASNANRSPEAAARRAREDAGIIDRTPDQSDIATPLGNWLEKTLAKYYKTDFGTETDPLRDLAARGLHYDPDMTPERWLDEANSSLMEDPIGYYTVPRHASEIMAEHNPPMFLNDFAGDVADTAHNLAPGLSYFGSADPIAQGALMQAAPWLRKQPVTDMLYGIKEPLDLGHFADEMRNAMSGQLPPDLAVRPEMLDRMSFAQAAERVGRINQFRAKEMERAALAAQDNPVTQMFKEYPDDPRGMRWVEMAPPKSEGAANYNVEEELQKALKYEGDTMGHCVGGYCPDVMSGRSRIFSLRDAKGMPHVTVETSPRSMVFSDLVAHLGGDEAAAEDYLTRGFQAREAGTGDKSPLAYALEMAQVPQGQDIVQIKGKQNRAPNPEYLPFVQDFVKSGQWGEIGDFGNTGLERLPDRRFITQAQLEEGIGKFYEQGGRKSPYYNQPENWLPEDWEQLKPHFEGYAKGGLAVKKCGCMKCGGLAVRKAV